MKQDHPFHFDSGYAEKNRIATVIFNYITASILLLLALPIFIVVPIIIRLQDGQSAFYAGKRMGRHKKPFTMYKFRTLRINAEQHIGSELVSTTALNVETPFGRFLRETRIDELPQLINVIKGDMDIIGPRPEREAVYEKTCKQIPWYDKRFAVKPGIIGYSQLFTPHSTPKKSRALIDNFYISRKHEFSADIKLLLYAVSILVFRLVKKVPRTLYLTLQRFATLGLKKEQRYAERINKRNTHIKLWYKEENGDAERLKPADLAGRVVNINNHHLLIETNEPLTQDLGAIELSTLYKPFLKRHKRYKSLHCSAQLLMQRPSPDASRYRYVLSMGVLSPLNAMKLHKYFLGKSIS